MNKELDKLRPHSGESSQNKIPINIISEPNKPKLNGGDLLDKPSVHAFTVARKNFQHIAVVLLTAFGVGMQIHLYSASYCTPSKNVNKPLNSTKLKWSKIATLDENTNELSETKLSVIVEALKSKLANEIKNLVRGKNR